VQWIDAKVLGSLDDAAIPQVLDCLTITAQTHWRKAAYAADGLLALLLLQ